MRYVIYGAGAVGSVIGGRLHRAGRDVTLIARGNHLRAVQESGLHIADPDRIDVVRVPVVGHPSSMDFEPGTVVVLAMKSQDTEGALIELAALDVPDLIIVCAQNGVENERLALRRFRDVYGMLVLIPAAFTEPGRVEVNLAPTTALLDIGLAAGGSDDRCHRIADHLRQATFDSRVSDGIMAWKYAKLLRNIRNGASVACGQDADVADLQDAAIDEGKAVLEAAAVPYIADEAFEERRAHLPKHRHVAGIPRIGSSTAQSLIRGSQSIEADFLNGEIVLLGRLCGVPTPVNEVFQRIVNRMAHEGLPPGAVSVEELREMIATAQPHSSCAPEELS